MNNIKILTPALAVKLANQLVCEAGFIKVSHSENNSHYYRYSKNIKKKIRISNHAGESYKKYVDYDLVFDYNTIKEDVVVKIEKMMRELNFNV